MAFFWFIRNWSKNYIDRLLLTQTLIRSLWTWCQSSHLQNRQMLRRKTTIHTIIIKINKNKLFTFVVIDLNSDS